MWVSLLVVACSLGADASLAPRLETLRMHVERLALIPVPEAESAVKAEKLESLHKAVEAGVADAAAYDALYMQIDEARSWLLAHATERPARAAGDVRVEGDAWRIDTPELKVAVNPQDFSMVVTTAKNTWNFGPSDRKDIRYRKDHVSLASAGKREASPLITGYSVGLQVSLSEFSDMPGLAVALGIHCTGKEIEFEWTATDPDAELEEVRWPGPLATEANARHMAVIPRMQGMLLPGDWPQPLHAEGLCNSRELYMPWWGQIRDSAGVMSILETPDDGGAAYDHPKGGPTTIQPIWYASLGQQRYTRRLRCVFQDEASYVSFAKRYRRAVIERGEFVSLAEKRVATPALDEVIGKPVLHLGSLYHFVPEASLFNKEHIEANHALTPLEDLASGLRQIKEHGLDDAYVHLDGWGFYGYDNGHPDVLPAGYEQGGWDGLRAFADTCRDLGYLFAVHDQYRDFYLNAASYDEWLAIKDANGRMDTTSTWCGGPQTFLNPRYAPGYVRRNHDLFAEHGIDVRGAYLDVFAVVPLEESRQAHAPITRTECAAYRRECFDVLKARGYVVSSEEPADYLVKTLHLVHHGPYATYPGIGGGDACGIPVPLFGLVYHDSLLLPWDTGEDGGWGIPKGDAGWLHCLLNAGLPYIGLGADAAQIERVKMAAALAQRCAFSEMTDHKFLDDTHRRQQTTYADGTTVTVDLDAKSYAITP